MDHFTKISVLFTFFIALSQVTVGQDEVSQREVIALLELKAKTKGHLWIHQWDQTEPVSTWHGVTVKDGKVVGLDLSNNNLKGRIPITIGNLKYLEVLDLSGNHIKGRIPGLYRKFENLRAIDLSDNNLIGSIPSAIYRLQNLEKLNLSNNKLNGEVPQQMAVLSKLKTLDLANNNLEGTVSVTIKSMKNLKTFDLTNNIFSDFDVLQKSSKQQIAIADVAVKK